MMSAEHQNSPCTQRPSTNTSPQDCVWLVGTDSQARPGRPADKGEKCSLGRQAEFKQSLP